MDLAYSLYDALVSINVPNDKARAVVDAMERDMFSRLATKADLLATKAELQAETQLLRQEMSTIPELLSKDIRNLENSMIIKLGTISGVWAGVLFALLKLTS